MLAAASVAAALEKLRQLLRGARNLRDFYALDDATLAELGIHRHDVLGRPRASSRGRY